VIKIIENNNTKKRALDFLEEAKSDLDSAKLLYENGKYNQSVFSLQQSVEKAVKSYALFSKIMDECEVEHDVGHKNMIVYDRIFEIGKEKMRQRNRTYTQDKPWKLFIQKTFPGHLKWFYRIFSNFRSADYELYQLREKTKDVRKQSKEDIQKMIETIVKLEEGVIKYENNFDEKMKDLQIILDSDDYPSSIQKIIEEMSTQGNIDPNNQKILNDFLKMLENPDILPIIPKIFSAIQSLIQINMESFFVVMSLLNLSVITQPHAIAARYGPLGKEKVPPSKFYTKDRPIVEKLSKLLSLQEITLNRQSHFYELSENCSEKFLSITKK
jgi:hypothetical protein